MTRFDASYSGIGEMLRSEFMQHEMRRRADKVKAEAVSRAPVGLPSEPDEHSGRYKASFTVESGVRPAAGRRKARAYGRVTNTAPEALEVEYGWHKTPKYRILGRALNAGAGD